MQTRFKFPEHPFLFHFQNSFGYYDMAKNRLVKKHICEVDVEGCIQVGSSLYAYIERSFSGECIWSSFKDFDQETVKETALGVPFFTARYRFSMANFYDQLILFSGGQLT